MHERITCNIPNKMIDSELHSLVTRYQLHKCSQYWKRRRKCGNTYITKCKFGFPRQPCETAKLNPVSDSLKSRSRIYQLTRSESETRVNDYNPLLLLLRKANIDIQFVAESSLALAHYVSGYVTKAENVPCKSIWQQISDNKSIYGRLWNFGVRSLRFRECGLYEASDLLLGEAENFHARAFGNRSVITKAYMVASGTLVCEACASENVACMKLVICCSVITSAKNPPVEGSQVVARHGNS